MIRSKKEGEGVTFNCSANIYPKASRYRTYSRGWLSDSWLLIRLVRKGEYRISRMYCRKQMVD